MARKRKSKRTHKVQVPDSSIPQSFVVKIGDCSPTLGKLVKETRRIMEPYTAINLKETKKNKVKDYLMVAGQLMVSHLLIFSHSTTGNVNLKIARIPRGPTFSFRVVNYSLIKDVLALQSKPEDVGNYRISAFSPLVVLNNFKNNQKHVEITANLLQNMFPSIKVSQVKLSECKRVVLFNFNAETNLIEWRHYKITTKALGLTKSVKTIMKANIPDLSKYSDISEFITKSAFASESDVEDAADAAVSLSDRSTDKRAIKLVEIGPRLDLKLVKIQNGLCEGDIIHHAIVTKTEQEILEIKKKRQTAEQLKASRRATQEENVRLKTEKAKQDSSVRFNDEEFKDLMEIQDSEEDGDDKEFEEEIEELEEER